MGKPMGNMICDLCGDGVPAVDLEEGRAYRRGPRLICAQCDRAMGGGGALPEEPSAAPPAKRRRRVRPATTGLWAVASLTGVLAGWSLWQSHQTGVENQRLQARLGEWESQQERAWTRFLTRTEEAWEGKRSGLSSEIAAGDAASRTAWREAFATMEQGLAELRAELASSSAEQREDLQALAQRVEAWQAEWRVLEETLTQLEELQIAGGQAVQSDLLALTERMDLLEKVAVPAEAPPTGVQAAPWFAITADLQHEQVAIRLDAVYSLEQSRDVRICPYLRPLLQDPDSLVRLAVARILAEYRFRPATPDLIAGLEDPVLSVRDGFVKALRRITGRQFGFRADARETERERPLESWRTWWRERGEAFLRGEPS